MTGMKKEEIMIPLLVASCSAHSGKTLMTLGLGLHLKALGYRIGYMKPLGKTPVKKGDSVVDRDALLMMDSLELPEPPSVYSPFVYDYLMQNALIEGTIENVQKRVIEAVETFKDKTIVLITGGQDLCEGKALNISAFDLADILKARVLLIDAWRGPLSIDSMLAAAEFMKSKVIGCVLNKVPDSVLNDVKSKVKPFLEKNGLKIFGTFRHDKVLESVTVQCIVDTLNGNVLCAHDRLDEFVESFLVGAMDADTAFSYFQRTPNKAVITGTHRPDIQLVALETSTKCIVLTGGMQPNDLVIKKAREKGIPLISVPGDTFSVANQAETMMGRTALREKRKIDYAKELFAKEFDLDRFLEHLS